MNKEDVVFRHKEEKITNKEVNSIFGNLMTKREKIIRFMEKGKTAKPIPVEKPGEYEVALFQLNVEGWRYSLSDIMVDYEIDKDNGEVTVKKLYRFMGELELETRIYYLENYGRTWRAWAAFPTEEAEQRWK